MNLFTSGWRLLVFLGVAGLAATSRGQSLAIIREGGSIASTPLAVSDFTDLPTLAGQLKNPARSFDRWLADALPEATKTALANYGGPPSDPAPLLTALVADFNTLLAGGSLYDPQRFVGIPLRPETSALLQSTPPGDGLLRLNRGLLEDAYPTGLARKEGQMWIEVVAPSDTRHRLEASFDLQEWLHLHDDVQRGRSYPIGHAAITQRFFRLAAWTPLDPIIVLLVGDSTVSDFMGFYGTGWGRGVYDDLKPEAQVVNLAWPGLSSRTFLTSEQMPKLRVIKPDFVLVQFGHADVFGCTGGQCTTTLSEYGENLRTIVRSVRDFDGTPILITPPVPRVFGEDGRVVPAYEDRCAVVREVAAELQTHLIDLNRLSSGLFNQLGEAGSAHISMGTDLFHYSPEGAEVIAGLVMQAVPNSLRRYLLNPLDQPLPP